MRIHAFVAALALIGACATPPDPDHRPTPAEIQPAPFHAQHGVYFKVVDDGASSLRRLFDHAPAQAPEGVTRAVERYRAGDERDATDAIYLTAPSRDALEHASQTLTVPVDRELAYGRVDGNHWRTYLLFPLPELDARAIAGADAIHDANTGAPAVMVELTPSGAHRFAELTARTVGKRLAVLVDGSVVAAPVINGAITGGRAEISLPPTASDAQAHALADAIVAAR